MCLLRPGKNRVKDLLDYFKPGSKRIIKALTGQLKAEGKKSGLVIFIRPKVLFKEPARERGKKSWSLSVN